jgi:hypothetical protein
MNKWLLFITTLSAFGAKAQDGMLFPFTIEHPAFGMGSFSTVSGLTEQPAQSGEPQADQGPKQQPATGGVLTLKRGIVDDAARFMGFVAVQDEAQDMSLQLHNETGEVTIRWQLKGTTLVAHELVEEADGTGLVVEFLRFAYHGVQEHLTD